MSRRKKKRKFWNIINVLTTLKSYVLGIVTGIPIMILVYLRGLVDPQRTILMMSANVILALYVVFNLWLWGFLANKWWKWE